MNIINIIAFVGQRMSIEQELLAHDNYDQNYQQEQKEEMKNSYRQKVKSIISSIPLIQPKSRQLLAKSYRRINALINKLENQQQNLCQDPQFLDDAIKSAFFYKPYDIQNPNFKYQSLLCREAVCANRRVRVPVIKVGEEIINQPGKSIRANVETGQFTLKIESEPNTNIIFTTKPRTHPLLELDPQSTDKKYCSNQFVQSMAAPCEVNIIAVSQSKIESKVMTVRVTTNQNTLDYTAHNIGYAIRPVESFPFEDSNPQFYDSGFSSKFSDQSDP